MSRSPHPLLSEQLQDQYREKGLWSDLTLREVLDRQAERAPDAPLYLGEQAKTYGEVAAAAARIAGYLVERGVGPGDTVVAPLVSGWEATALVAATSGGLWSRCASS